MPIPWRNPRFWLFAQMAAVAIVAGAFGLLELETLPDTPTYTAAAEASPAEMLVGMRTIGYPLFLKATAVFSPDFRLVPWIQLAAFFAAVWFFETSVRRFGAAPWEAFALGAGLLWAGFQDVAVRTLLADFLAMVAAVLAVAWLMRLATNARRVWPWIGFTFCLAATYHVRPAYLFLIPLAPLLGLWLCWLAKRDVDRDRPKGLVQFRFAAGLVAATIGPYLAFCFMRLVLVGHFGLVSFGGYSIVGIAVELIDNDMIRHELPESLRPLAADIARRREERGLKSVFRGGGVIRIRQWELQYNDNVWRVAVPAAVERYGNQPVVINEKLSALSHAAIRRRAADYCLFVAYSLPRAVLKYFYFSWAAQILVPIGLALLAVRRYRSRREHQAAALGDWGPETPSGRLLCAAGGTAASFLLAKTSLLVLVICVGSRYLLPAGVFVPAALALWVYREARRLRANRCTEDTGHHRFLPAEGNRGQCPWPSPATRAA